MLKGVGEVEGVGKEGRLKELLEVLVLEVLEEVGGVGKGW